MDNQTIAEKLTAFSKGFRNLSCRLQAFAEEVEVDRIRHHGDTERFEQQNHLRSTVNQIRIHLEQARYDFGYKRLSYSQKSNK